MDLLESLAAVSLPSDVCFYSFISRQQVVQCTMEEILMTLLQAMWLKL